MIIICIPLCKCRWRKREYWLCLTTGRRKSDPPNNPQSFSKHLGADSLCDSKNKCIVCNPIHWQRLSKLSPPFAFWFMLFGEAARLSKTVFPFHCSRSKRDAKCIRLQYFVLCLWACMEYWKYFKSITIHQAQSIKYMSSYLPLGVGLFHNRQESINLTRWRRSEVCYLDVVQL